MYLAAREKQRADEFSAAQPCHPPAFVSSRCAVSSLTTSFEKVRALVSCRKIHSARGRVRVGLLAGLFAIASCGAYLSDSVRAEDGAAHLSFEPALSAADGTIANQSSRRDDPNDLRDEADDERLLRAAAGLSGGSVLQFVGLTTITLDSGADAAIVDEDVAPGPSDPVAPKGEAAPANVRTSSISEDADGAGHELWIVSTRNLSGNFCDVPPDAFSPGVERFICGQGWTRSNLDELISIDNPAVTTAILIHGNDTDAGEAETRGREFYRELMTGCCTTGPMRLIVWSWPSDKVVPCFRKDAQLKACRTNVEGYYLARFVDLLGPNSPVTVGGYSYGSRVVTGGLHLLGGGVLEGRQLTDRVHPDRHPATAVLMGAAVPNNWLLPGMRHDRAVSQVDRLVVLFNPKDFVLHFYPRLWGGRGPEALGATGLAAGRLGDEAVKVKQFNVQPQMHRRHGWDYFASSPAIMTLVRRELLSPPIVEQRAE